MTDHPIIFSAPMIAALLAVRKTQTRRLAWREGKPRDAAPLKPLAPFKMPSPWQKVRPGDRLWVRENFTVQQVNRHWELIDGKSTEILSTCIDYEADAARTWIKLPAGEMPKVLTARKNRKGATEAKGSPNIHLPAIASRLTLVVEAVKVEPLQAISETDALAEGLSPLPNGRFHCGYDDEGEITCKSPVTAYAWLWDSLHWEGAWMANPDVVALTFRVVKENIDRIKEE